MTKLCLIDSKFLGSKVVDRGTSDVELGCLLHSIGTKKWKWRKCTPVTLGFVQKSFVITFNHHGEETRVCDLRDVNKVSVHPTQERVVGFVLNDRQSHTHRFLCFKLCRDANIKGHEFKKLHQVKLQLLYPLPKVKLSTQNVRKVQDAHSSHTTEAKLRQVAKAVAPRIQINCRHRLSAVTTSLAHSRQPSTPHKEKQESLRPRHKYGYYINGKLIGVGHRPTAGQCSAHQPSLTNRDFPIYENLVPYQQQQTLPTAL